MLSKINNRWKRLVQLIMTLLTIGAIIQIAVQQEQMTNRMIEERDNQLFSMARSIDNMIEHEFWEMKSDLNTVINLPAYRKVEEQFIQDQDDSDMEMMIYLANVNSRNNEECILVEEPDGRMTVLGDHPDDTFTFLADEDGDEYEVCYDSTGEYYLSVCVESGSKLRYHILLNLYHFYDNIVPPELQSDYWIVFADEESGLMVQNHDNQKAYLVLLDEELEERDDGYTIIMKNQKKRQKGAETYNYPNYHGEMVKERIITLPSNETENGSFAIGIAQDSHELYQAIRHYTFRLLAAMIALLLAGIYAIFIVNNYYVENELEKERIEHLQTEKALVEKVSEAKLQNSISQMQPHFMYNALSSIRELIFEDPKMAADKLYDFTKYLRACIKGLRTRETIPFEDELEHIKVYTSIEQMRFGEGVHIEYDIEERDFSVPALSIQPLVENAIRHGIVKKRGKKGTVTIRTRLVVAGIQIEVEDDGLGFDYDAIMQEVADGKRDSIGLSNTILRLEKSIGATVVVESAVGYGTKVIITIPVTE